jgi:hypothetical protein
MAQRGSAVDDVGTFRAQGFLSLGQLLDAPALHRLQAAFHREQAIWRRVQAAAQDAAKQQDRALGSLASREPAQERPWRSPGYFDIPRVLETDDAYLELLCAPRLAALVCAVVGEDAMVEHVQARTLLGRGSESRRERDHNYGSSYTGWHNDGGTIGLFDHPVLSPSVKLFVALNDHTEANGCTCVLPATHNRGLTLGCADAPPAVPTAAAMPGRVPLELRAGEAFLLDIRAWHCAMPNLSNRDREGLIVQFSPFRRKQEWLTECAGTRLHAANKLTTPTARQLLGVELIHLSLELIHDTAVDRRWYGRRWQPTDEP